MLSEEYANGGAADLSRVLRFRPSLPSRGGIIC